MIETNSSLKGEDWTFTNWASDEANIPDALVLLKNPGWKFHSAPSSTTFLPFLCETTRVRLSLFLIAKTNQILGLLIDTLPF